MSSSTSPTRSNLSIRGAADAFALFEAVRTGLLPLRRNRLSQVERDSLTAGQVFVWVESTEADGLERWTDGRKWSASRTRDVFLVYEERDEPSLDESLQKASRKINSSFPPNSNSESGDLFGIFAFPRDRQPKPGGLIKQTFSAWVVDPPGARTKWHLSAYLDRAGGPELRKVSEDAILSGIRVPEGVYECCTGPRKHRKVSLSRTPSELLPSQGLPSKSNDVDSAHTPYVLSPMTSPTLPNRPVLPRIIIPSEHSDFLASIQYRQAPCYLPSPASISPPLSPHSQTQSPGVMHKTFDFQGKSPHTLSSDASPISFRPNSPFSDRGSYCKDHHTRPRGPNKSPKIPKDSGDPVDSTSRMILFRRLPPPSFPTIYNSRSPLDCITVASFSVSN